MPGTGQILWIGIAGVIAVLLGMIAWFVRTGFDSLRQEMKAQWAELKAHQKAQTDLQIEFTRHQAICEQRHKDDGK